ncbi:hypothetical protein LOK49_LG01G00882 [Camellia lanceoleosa]|uniref:Uncharacterized protein n=1 Tax=Camellia lanceoleosa TaxID=1840588 RepID=A0ACC0ISJ3_9ERIC|nr:hypothetical protein LOK49_LG01G00882 [Camellia lanceoleosa]
MTHQPQPNLAATTCALTNSSRQVDLTMVEATQIQSQVVFPIPNISPNINLGDHRKRESVPLDLGDLNDGEARTIDLRGAQVRGARTLEANQCNGIFVRATERSTLPRHFRLVDRTNPTDNRTKLGEQPNEAIPCNADGFHESSGERPSVDI